MGLKPKGRAESQNLNRTIPKSPASLEAWSL